MRIEEEKIILCFTWLKMKILFVYIYFKYLTWLKMEGALSGPEVPLKSHRISEAMLCASVLGSPLEEDSISHKNRLLRERNIYNGNVISYDTKT